MWCDTEYKRHGITFRCHPNYKNEGPWYDYVLVAWDNPSNATYSKEQANMDDNREVLDDPVMTEEKDKTSNVLLIPAKIICFVQDINENYFTVIHSCHENSANMSVITYRWQLEYEGESAVWHNLHPHDCLMDAIDLTPIYHVVSVETLQKHCLMIPYKSGGRSQFLMQVVDQHKWANSFANI